MFKVSLKKLMITFYFIDFNFNIPKLKKEYTKFIIVLNNILYSENCELRQGLFVLKKNCDF